MISSRLTIYIYTDVIFHKLLYVSVSTGGGVTMGDIPQSHLGFITSKVKCASAVSGYLPESYVGYR